MENSVGTQEAGVGAVIDDPDQQACADEEATLAATLDGGAASSSWYWTSMLNFSQSGSSSTHTSAGQMAPSHLSAPAASPPSSSSVHIHHADQHPASSIDNILASHTANNNTLSNDPEHSVWSQEFLSGPIGESKASIHACTDDGLQELLYPRTVRELLFSDQLKLDPSSSWDLLQQAAISKTFGFPLGPEDPMQSLVPAQLHSVSTDIKPGQLLHYSHDDRLSSSTASSTLSDNTQQLAEQWAAPSPAAQPPCEHAQPRTCAMHVPHTTLLQQQFDHARVKQEYPTHPNNNNNINPFNNTSNINYGKSPINPFLLQHQHQQHNLRLINPNHDQAAGMINEALITPDTKPSKLNSWPSSPAAIQLCRSSSSFELAGLPSPAAAGDHHHHSQLIHPMKQHNLHDINAGFANPNLPLINQDPSFFQPEHLLQQAMQAHHHHHHHGGLLNTTPLQYLNHPQLQGGLKKTRAHIEGGQVGAAAEEGKEKAGGATDQKVGNIPHDKQQQQLCDDFNFKRPRVDHQQQQQQQHQTPSSSSFKSQPVRKEKLGERITTLQQLVSPFGKTDTASVLLEAIGYIKFLQDQVQTLSSPYLKSTNNTTLTQNGEKNQNGEEVKPDLRSKGLCLVPLSCTMQVANDNGADYWYGGAFR